MSRTYRLALTGLVTWGVVSIFLDGAPGFAPATIREPGFWVLGLVSLPVVAYEVPRRVLGRRWGRRWLAVLGLLLAAAAAVALDRHGVLWASPLTTLVYGSVLAGAVLAAVALVLSVLLGSPGCDLAVVDELVRRRRRTAEPRAARPARCIAGLHLLDAWEARQPWRRGGAP